MVQKEILKTISNTLKAILNRCCVMYSIKLGGSGRNATLKADIQQSLTLIVYTGKGERVHMPDYAADALKYLDRPQWELPRMLVSIAESVKKYEPRIRLDEIQVTSREPAKGIMQLRLIGKIVETGETTTFHLNNN